MKKLALKETSPVSSNKVVQLVNVLYPSKDEMVDLHKNRKEGKAFDRIYNRLSLDDANKFANDFHKKHEYEITPMVLLNRDHSKFFEKFFGFKGHFSVNMDTHGTDAKYIGAKGKEVNIELKVIKVGRNAADNGYKLGRSAWKFRDMSDEFYEDYAFLVIMDNKTDSILDVIILDNEEVVGLINDREKAYKQRTGKTKTKNQLHGSPWQITYNNVEDKPHLLNGELLTCKVERAYKELFSKGVITKKGRNYFILETKFKRKSDVIEVLGDLLKS